MRLQWWLESDGRCLWVDQRWCELRCICGASYFEHVPGPDSKRHNLGAVLSVLQAKVPGSWWEFGRYAEAPVYLCCLVEDGERSRLLAAEGTIHVFGGDFGAFEEIAAPDEQVQTRRGPVTTVPAEG